jgi:hypothetical protein
MKSSGVHKKKKKDAATNPPIQGRKNSHLWPGIADAK